MQRRTLLVGGISAGTFFMITGCTVDVPQPTPSTTASALPSPSSAQAVPSPAGMLRSNWSAAPYYGGSGSYLKVGATPALREALAASVADRVFFAGEATSAGAPGTVEGARATGERAAEEVAAVAEDGERIAIVGAGIAGATAARILVDAGYSVRVFEASDRVGGRIDTRRDDGWDVPAELGANLLPADSPLKDALDRLEVISLLLEDASTARDADGGELAPSSVGTDAIAAAVASAAASPNDVSLASALLQVRGVDAFVEPDPADGAAPTTRQRIDAALAGQVEIPYGADAASFSARSGFGDGEHDGERGGERIVLTGFDTLVTDALDGVDVLTSNVVAEISYGDDGVGIRIATGESQRVDRVIVTVPLGVLKSGDITFEPRLPVEHAVAIVGLGMGVSDRVWLRYDEKFWTTDATRWSVIGSDFAITDWINLEPATGSPILVGLVGGDRALALAAADDDEVIELARRSLEPFVD